MFYDIGGKDEIPLPATAIRTEDSDVFFQKSLNGEHLRAQHADISVTRPDHMSRKGHQ